MEGGPHIARADRDGHLGPFEVRVTVRQPRYGDDDGALGGNRLMAEADQTLPEAGGESRVVRADRVDSDLLQQREGLGGAVVREEGRRFVETACGVRQFLDGTVGAAPEVLPAIQPACSGASDSCASSVTVRNDVPRGQTRNLNPPVTV